MSWICPPDHPHNRSCLTNHGCKCDSCKEIGRLYHKRWAKKKRDFIAGFKDRPCLDCGTRYPSYVMDFDHRPGAHKLFNIGEQLHGGWSEADLRTEIAKCDVVCANCHRIRTARRREDTNADRPSEDS